jgi:antitoxin ParD1/3/4
MHISLTPKLEEFVKAKVAAGMYNNASEVIREALRFMEAHEDLVYQIKLDRLRREVAKGAEQAERGMFSTRNVQDIISDLNAAEKNT